jgi:hypothetical protein
LLAGALANPSCRVRELDLGEASLCTMHDGFDFALFLIEALI